MQQHPGDWRRLAIISAVIGAAAIAFNLRRRAPRRVLASMTINRQEAEIAGFWRTLRETAIGRFGRVDFHPLSRGGTRVTVEIEHDQLNRRAQQMLREDLRRMKSLIETGEIPAGAAPAGTRTLKFRALETVMP